MEGLIFGGACLRREICVSKSIGLAFQLEGNLPFLLCFTLYLRAISKYKLSRGGGGGRLYLEGLIHGGAYFRNFSVCPEMHAMAMMASLAKKNARGLVKIYKRLQEVLLVKWQS